MSIDGAFEGVRAESAMRMAMGGRAEEEPAPSTKEERRAEIEAATIGSQDMSASEYNKSALYAAKMILHTIEANPRIDWASIPTEPTYDWSRFDEDGVPTVVERGWLDALRDIWSTQDTSEWSGLGITGFQWGWAVNTVRWLLDMEPVGNPAIVEIN